MRMADKLLSFAIDTVRSDESGGVATLNNLFPIFNSSKFTLEVNEEEDSEKSENNEDGDEYFGKLHTYYFLH